MTKNKRFKAIRNELGLTQAEFGKKLGFKQSKIKDIEIGKLKVTAEIAILLEQKFSIDLRWILTGEGNMLLNGTKKIKESNSKIEKIITMLNQMNDKDLQDIQRMSEERLKIKKMEKKINEMEKKLAG